MASFWLPIICLLHLFSDTLAFATSARQRPNVIVIFTDDHGYADLGCQQVLPDVLTPHIDGLAARGVRMTNGYITAPQCVPSRGGLMTGRYQNKFGLESNVQFQTPGGLDGFNQATTIAERLKTAGYVTGMAGKWHLGPPAEIGKHGFDLFFYKNSNRRGLANFDLDGSDRPLGAEDTGLYHVDALAAGGMRFDNAFVTTSLCSPARASFLTGQYMHNHKVVNNADLMREGTVTFPQLLQKAGYDTAFIGKWHMGGSSDAPRPGFDHWVSFRGQGSYFPDGQQLNVDGERKPQQKYMTDELTDYATRWLSDRRRETPFLLYLAHKGVHGLYDPAPRHRDRYKNEKFAPPSSITANRPVGAGKPMWVRDQRNSWHGVEFPYHGRSRQTLAEMYRHYCEMVLSIDDSVGQLMATLEGIGAEENTLVVFTSDGGHLWGEHGLIDKRCAYEASIRIPFLAHWPAGIRRASRCDAVVANIDLAPTLLDLAGVAIPEQMDGQSLRPLLSEPNADTPREALLYEYYWEPAFPQTPTTFALREGRYKLIQYHGIWDTDELYDLATDPDETRNLILEPEQQNRVQRMRRRLHERLRASGGLEIPLGFKRNHGSNQRRTDGSKRARFPEHMISP